MGTVCDLRHFVEGGPDGMSAGGEIAERIGLVPSSLTFHVPVAAHGLG